MYSGTSYDTAIATIPAAVESFSNMGIVSPISDYMIEFNEVITIDITGTFAHPNDEAYTVTLDTVSNPDVVTATLDGNTLTVTAQEVMDVSEITLLATADDGLTCTETFEVSVIDPSLIPVTFNLFDSYGDGWGFSGLVNYITLGDQEITLETGSEGQVLVFLSEGDYDYTYTANDGYGNENSWTINLEDGTEIGSGSGGANGTSDHSFTVPSMTLGSISGTVTLVDGEGSVTDVVVTAGTQTTNPAADGSYSFDIYTGTYTVTAELDGYDDAEVTDVVVLADQDTGNVNLELTETPESLLPACDLEVTPEGLMSWGAPGSGAVNDFEGTTLPAGWAFDADIWSMENDSYLTGTGTSASAFHWAHNNQVVENGVFEFVWQRTSGSETSSQGCLVRSDNGDMNTGSGYIFVFSGNGSYICGTVNGGSFDDPWVSAWTASANLITGLGQDNVITISMQGSDFEMYINGVLELTHTDTAYPSGINTIGFYETEGDVVKFDRYGFEADATVSRSNPANLADLSTTVISENNTSLFHSNIVVDNNNTALAVGPEISTPALSNDRDLLHYIVSLDGVEQGTTTETTYQLTGLIADTEYTASVVAVYDGGDSTPIEVTFTAQNVDGNNPEVPVANALVGNYPNPFNPTTSIKFATVESGHVTLDVYNAKGQKVKTLVNETLSADTHTVDWNGTDDSGKAVSSGIYFYKMSTDNFSNIKKMVLMK